MTKKEKETYTTREFAHKFRLHVNDIQQACKAGKIKAKKDEKGRWRIPKSEVEKFMKIQPPMQ